MLIEDENISSSILPFKKDVPLAIDDADIAFAKTPNIPMMLILLLRQLNDMHLSLVQVLESRLLLTYEFSQ